MATTLKDIATEAGVSIRTVTRYLKNEPHISRGRFERIKLAINKLGYTPNLLARGLKTNRKNLLGIIAPPLNHVPVLTNKLVALQREAVSAGFRTMVGIPEHGTDQEARFAAEFSQFCDGLLFLTHPPASITGRLLADNTPFVLVDHPSGSLPAVPIDRGTGITAALRQLHGSYYSYLFVSPDANPDEPRRHAFDTTLAELGHSGAGTFIKSVQDAFKGGYGAGDRVAAADQPLVICYNDRVATGLIKRLTELKIRIPEHCGIVGFDDDAYPAWLPVPLSTVSQSVDDLAARALMLLENRINRDDTSAPGPVPTRFIKRESTV